MNQETEVLVLDSVTTVIGDYGFCNGPVPSQRLSRPAGTAIGPNLSSNIAPRSKLDGQIGYDITNQITFSLQARNLAPEDTSTEKISNFNPAAIKSYALSLRHFSIGVRARFQAQPRGRKMRAPWLALRRSFRFPLVRNRTV